MKILIAGIYRSGSTWLYNAVRYMYAQKMKTQGTFIWFPYSESFDCHVIKTHAYYEQEEMEFIPDFVITSTRPSADITQSMKAQRAKGLEPGFKNAGAHEDLEEFLGWLKKWEAHPQHVYQMDFKDLHQKRIMSILRDLNEAMEMDLSNEQMIKVQTNLKRMRPPTEGFGPTTLLTPTHIK